MHGLWHFSPSIISDKGASKLNVSFGHYSVAQEVDFYEAVIGKQADCSVNKIQTPLLVCVIGYLFRVQ